MRPEARVSPSWPGGDPSRPDTLKQTDQTLISANLLQTGRAIRSESGTSRQRPHLVSSQLVWQPSRRDMGSMAWLTVGDCGQTLKLLDAQPCVVLLKADEVCYANKGSSRVGSKES
jgi:hypothetical protein